MKKAAPTVRTRDPWTGLNRFTNARIALGRAGMSQPTDAHLAFQLAHARARDAVNRPLDFDKLQKELAIGGMDAIRLVSAAADRQTYLQRPELGRQLGAASEKKLEELAGSIQPPDIALVICDGLSSPAIQGQAAAFMAMAARAMKKNNDRLSPVCLVAQGRVAVADVIGEILSSKMTVVLIGERPGLSSPESMGIYFTYGPQRGATDAERNCISNIHENGLSHGAALEKLLFLITEADRLKQSGVRLKDRTPGRPALKNQTAKKNFLLE